jgi:hypothetical protein
MEIFLISFAVVSLAVVGMAVGVLAGRRPLAGGGCGGKRDGGSCDICGADGDGARVGSSWQNR